MPSLSKVLGGVLATVALAATAGIALAGSSFESEVTIHVAEKAAHADISALGRVKSSKHACEKRRKVVVYGHTAGGETDKLGSDRADGAGGWRVDNIDNLGLRWIQARAKPKEIHAGTCKRARSARHHFA
jgi:hypothetical protein